MRSRWAPVGRKWLPAVVAALVASQLWGPTAVIGQSPEEPIIGLEFEDEDLLAVAWVDPIVSLGLENEPFVEADFDLADLHPSVVFEEGVENLPIRGEVDVSLEADQHLRAVAAIATAEQALLVAGQDIVSQQQSIRSASARIEAAGGEITIIEEQIGDLLDETEQIIAADNAEIEERLRLDADIDTHEAAIAEFAIQAFIASDDGLTTIAADPLSLEPVTRRIITDEARESQREAIVALDGLVDENNARRGALAQERATAEAATRARRAAVASLDSKISDLRAGIGDSRREISRLEGREVDLERIVEEAIQFSEATAFHYQLSYHRRLEEFVSGTDIPLVALNAYVRASRALAVEDPSCGIHWSQLAGIGRIESAHGNFGDSTLDVNGQTTEPIRGIALDGRVLSGSGSAPDATGRTQTTNTFSRLALIRDTDNGRLDGDTEFDRAVGPMQFIPTTWQLYDDSDGNGDETVDPQNVYDATLAAARYLCDAPGSMLTAEGEQRAYFAYNHDFAYSRNVTVAGRSYHERLSITPETSPAFAAYAASGEAEALAAANLGEGPECEADDAAEDAPEEVPAADVEGGVEGEEESLCEEDEGSSEDEAQAQESAPAPVEQPQPEPPAPAPAAEVTPETIVEDVLAETADAAAQ